MFRQEDFDTFWKKKLDIITNVELNFSLFKKEFSTFNDVEYYDLYFTSYDGAKIYAKYIKNTKFRRENTAKKIPALFYFHGYPASSRNWLEKSSYCALGYDVFALDFRGQGGLSKDIGSEVNSTVFGHLATSLAQSADDMIFVKNIIDMCLLLRIASSFEDIDENNFVSYGASQGGAFSLICAALNKNIKKCIALYPFLSDLNTIYSTNIQNSAYSEINLFSRWYNVDGDLDDLILTKLSYIDTINFVPKITAPVLFGISELDADCPPQTQKNVFDKIASPKKLLSYKKYKHEDINHFGNEVLTFLLNKTT